MSFLLFDEGWGGKINEINLGLYCSICLFWKYNKDFKIKVVKFNFDGYVIIFGVRDWVGYKYIC